MLFLISLLSFLLPTQLSYHFKELSSFVYGFKIDYLSPSLYLTDIVAAAIIVLGLTKYKFKIKHLYLVLLYLLFVFLNINQSLQVVPSVFKWIKISELILLGITIYNTQKFKVFNNFVNPLSYSVAISCILGILQYFNKGSIGGIFYWLGERSFIFNNPDIAPYPYSIFSHPNSFAGFLLVYSLFVIKYRGKFNKRCFLLLVSLIVVNLILTNSLNVYLTIILLISIKLLVERKMPLFFIDLNARYITHRLELIGASWQMIKSHFMFGVGLNNFIPNLVKVSNSFVNSWELQPVHNIFLLIFSETGIIGFILFIFLLGSSFSIYNYPLVAIILTGISDHYWITLQQNLLLFVYVLVITRKQKNKSTV